jgi:pyridoxine 5-phosphate synthase
MTRLSVNINKIASLRNARGGNLPDVCEAAKKCEHFGADGITVHPRPDERHITYQDVHHLSGIVKTEFNVEGYPSDRFMELVLSVKPAQVTLVPDPPGVLTSNAGWDTVNEKALLDQTIEVLHKSGIRTSLFVDTESKNIEGAKICGADRIELFTGNYAHYYHQDKQKAIHPFVKAAAFAQELGLGVNAGHDLNIENLRFFAQKIPNLLEVSIGHALISDALYLGLENTIQLYKGQLQ